MEARDRRMYLTFGDYSSKDFLMYLSGEGIYNSAAPDTEAVTIPGRNGEIIQNNAVQSQRRFSNVDITYSAFFWDGIAAKTKAVKAWLLSPVGYQKLADTYDPDFYRMAICTSAVEFTPTRHKVAEMTLTFNCKPQRWSVAGTKTVSVTSSGTVIQNPFDFYSEPLITVYGSSKGVLTIGDTSVTIYSFTDGVCVLNSETQNAYTASGEFCNDTILADTFPTFAPGDNTISWSGGITSVDIVPRWWTL